MYGQIDLTGLPPIIREKIQGYLSGIITTDLRTKGNASMLGRRQFHSLVADGYVTATDIYFLSGDIDKMVEVDNSRIDFSSGIVAGRAPMFNAKLATDTAAILIGGVDITLGSLTLGLGVENSGYRTEIAGIPPVDGKLKVDRLNIISITDSAGGRISDLAGNIRLYWYGMSHRLPEIFADLHPVHVSAGSL